MNDVHAGVSLLRISVLLQDSVYGAVRHPIHAALIVALFSTAHMTGVCVCGYFIFVSLLRLSTVGRLLFAVVLSAFLVVHATLSDQSNLKYVDNCLSFLTIQT
jgi:hypothetical protein